MGRGAVIPIRRYLVDGVLANKSGIRKMLREVLTMYVMEGINNFDYAGSFIVERVKDFVRSGYYRDVVPNAPATIRRKRSDIPLIDTGIFLDSLTSRHNMMPKGD